MSPIGFGSRLIAVATSIVAGLMAGIIITGAHLIQQINRQDAFLTDAFNLSRHSLEQFHREVLRLLIQLESYEEAAQTEQPINQADWDAFMLQINLVESRVKVMRQHHIIENFNPDLKQSFIQATHEWSNAREKLNQLRSSPTNPVVATEVIAKLETIELTLNDSARLLLHEQNREYSALVTARSKSLKLLLIILLLLLLLVSLIVYLTVQFIQERQRVLLALNASEEQYRNIVETSEEGIWLLTPEGQSLFVNQKIVTMLGLSSQEDLRNQSLFDFFDSEEQIKVAQQHFQQLYQGRSEPCDLKLRRSDGTDLWVLINSTLTGTVREETSTGSLSMLTDITARKGVEAELIEAKQRAEMASLAKSEFLSNISHELRTPLNGILGYAQILSEATAWGKEERKGIQVIEQCGQHLLTLINDVLDLAKIEARTLDLIPQPVHLRSFLSGVISMIRIRATQKGLCLIDIFDEQLPVVVKVDERRLRQVLINLLGNAVKFTQVGSVTLKVEVVGTTSEPSTMPSSVKVRFLIQDTGVGMSLEHLKVIFQPFEQVGDRQKQTEGTGLGLAISQQIVQLMGSQIQVTSQLGMGSCFFFDVNLVPLLTEGVETVASCEAPLQATLKQTFSDLVLPSEAVLTGLLMAVQHGRFDQLRQDLDNLVASDPRYQAFAAAIEPLADIFDADAIEALITEQIPLSHPF